MKAALKTDEGTFEIDQVDTPELPGDDWVRARVRVAGICGTDLRHWKKHEPENVHHIMGHELSGEVVEVGPAVTNVAPGDRVVIETVLGDGTCDYCRVQRYNICPHLYEVRTKSVSRAYAEYVIGPAHKFYQLPENVSFEEAALVDTFSVCLHAHHLGGVGINDKVAVIGGGPIGMGQLMLAKASGADVILVDVVESALTMARDLGADAVVNSTEEDAAEAIKAFSGGRGVDIAFECAGGETMAETLGLATKAARRGGKVVIVGGFDEGETAIPLEWQRIQMSEIRLIPSASFAFHDIYPEEKMVVELISKGKLNAKKLITHSFPIDRINEAFEVAQKKDETGAVFVALTIS
jgi:L-iditol 2-dehydrogenase